MTKSTPRLGLTDKWERVEHIWSENYKFNCEEANIIGKTYININN